MPIPKFLGFDCELSTSGLDRDGRPLAPIDATRGILARIDAAFERSGASTWSRARSGSGYQNSTDCLRHWAPNGQCFYMDLCHLEICGAATLHPRDFAAQRFAALTVAEEARARAEEEEDGARYTLTAANVDTADPGISWGTHLDVCIEKELFDNLFHSLRRPAVFGFVASAMAAIVPFFGAGLLLPSDEGLIYSLAARAHHLTRTTTHSTTQAYERGLLNSRQEGHGAAHERLHLISTDFTLVGAALEGAVVQGVLAAAEDDCCALGLLDPVLAMLKWSWGFDPATRTVPTAAELVDGRHLTLPRYLRELCELLLARYAEGRVDESITPGAEELLGLVVDLTHWLEEGAESFPKVARHLDWAAKWLHLEQVAGARPSGFDDPALRLIDHDFTRTNLRGGALWQLWERGLVDPLVDRAKVEAFLVDGPPETRAWARGRLIRRFGAQLTAVDWSLLELHLTEARWAPRLRIALPSMTSLDRASFEPIVESARNVQELARLLDRVTGVETETIAAYFGIRTYDN